MSVLPVAVRLDDPWWTGRRSSAAPPPWSSSRVARNGAGRARARLAGPDGPVLAVLFGINLLVVGILQLVAAFSDAPRRNGRGLSCMLGTLSLLVGLLCLRDPLQTLLVLGQSASPCFRHGYLGPGCFRRRYGLGWR
jgi:hypothetical protein